MAVKNDWVRIHRNVLEPEDRTGKLPEDTKKVPLEDGKAEIGDEVTVMTCVGRLEHGKMIEVNPCYDLGYGEFVPEILQMEESLRTALFGGDGK